MAGLLTDRKLMNISETGDYSDGPDANGLKIRAVKVGDGDELTMRWVQRVYIKDSEDKTIRTRDLGHGVYPQVSLKEAHEVAEAYQKLADQGLDPRPLEDKKEEETRIPTFTELAGDVLEEGYERHRAGQIRGSTLESKCNIFRKYILPAFVDRPVDEISPMEIETWLGPLHRTKRPTFNRVWSIARSIFNRAILRTSIEVNPVNDAAMDSLNSRGKTRHQVAHFESVPFHRVAEAVDIINSGSTTSRTLPTQLALRFIVLTGCRSVEVRTMEWTDLRWKVINSPTDWGEGVKVRRNGTVNYEGWQILDWEEFERASDKEVVVVWFIPPEHAKMGKWHRIPLSSDALAVLREARTLYEKWDSDLVFPSCRKTHGPLGRSTLNRRCRDLAIDGTPHGFRTSLRIWCAVHDVPETAAEIALSHELQGVMSAYMRSDLLATRASIMDFWSQYLRGEIPEDWEWVTPKAAAEIQALKEERDALKEQLGQLMAIHETLTKITESLRAAEERAEKAEAENAAMKARYEAMELELKRVMHRVAPTIEMDLGI